jgi:protein gp37
LAAEVRGVIAFAMYRSCGVPEQKRSDCTKVSPGCDHCYAEAWSKRSSLVDWGNNPRRRTTDSNWQKPLKWNRQAGAFKHQHGRWPRIFCSSLADVFDSQAEPEWRKELFCLIRQCDALDWLLLTKRPQNIAKMLPSDWGDGYLNVWLGVSHGKWQYCASQIRGDLDAAIIDHLIAHVIQPATPLP